MSSTRSLIHQSWPNRSIVVPFISLLGNHLVRINWMLRQPLNIDCTTLTFSYFQASCGFIIRISQQILNFLVVDFKHRKLNLILSIRILIWVDSLENLITCNWYNTFVFLITNLQNETLTKFTISKWQQYLPWSNSFQNLSTHKQISNNGSLTRHYWAPIHRDTCRPFTSLRNFLPGPALIFRHHHKIYHVTKNCNQM